MTQVVTSVETLVLMGSQLVAVVGGLIWMKTDISQTKKDIGIIKKALGLEDGDDPSFVRASNFDIIKEDIDRRLEALEKHTK